MNNSDMKAGRFERWAIARRRVAGIRNWLERGGSVQLTTYTKAKIYRPACRDMFKANRAGAWVARGKSWDCIDGTHISFHGKVMTQ